MIKSVVTHYYWQLNIIFKKSNLFVANLNKLELWILEVNLKLNSFYVNLYTRISNKSKDSYTLDCLINKRISNTHLQTPFPLTLITFPRPQNVSSKS